MKILLQRVGWWLQSWHLKEVKKTICAYLGHEKSFRKRSGTWPCWRPGPPSSSLEPPSQLSPVRRPGRGALPHQRLPSSTRSSWSYNLQVDESFWASIQVVSIDGRRGQVYLELVKLSQLKYFTRTGFQFSDRASSKQRDRASKKTIHKMLGCKSYFNRNPMRLSVRRSLKLGK